jgi:uncharacterized protein
MSPRADELIAFLGLRRHPEGGYYGEVHRSISLVHPLDGRGARSALTAIYFLLARSDVSRWHRVLSDEVWHFCEGSPLQLWMADSAAESISRVQLGELAGDRRPLGTVPGGCWQAARSTGDYTLVGCTVGPGFDFNDFTLAVDCPPVADRLRRHSSEVAGLL